jgi:hypothetical protein
MHACLSHVYARALPYLFIYLMLIMGIGHGLAHAYLFSKQRPIAVMLMSSIRLCYFSCCKLPNGFSSLADSFLWLCVIPSGFVAVNMELSGITRQVPSFGI